MDQTWSLGPHHMICHSHQVPVGRTLRKFISSAPPAPVMGNNHLYIPGQALNRPNKTVNNRRICRQDEGREFSSLGPRVTHGLSVQYETTEKRSHWHTISVGLSKWQACGCPLSKFCKFCNYRRRVTIDLFRPNRANQLIKRWLEHQCRTAQVVIVMLQGRV